MRSVLSKPRQVSLLALLLASAAPCAVLANPTDGTVAAGSVAFGSSGNTLTVTQSSDKAVIDWRTFNIGIGETTNFVQPSSSSITLNRVNSASASYINGNLNANGNLIIVNQNGVLFGKNSVVNVNGLIASTADIDNVRFMSDRVLTFNKPGNPNATIENQGLITAKAAGLVGLVAPNVLNSGVINARLGRIHLASGDTVTVDLYGDGLMEVKASAALQSQLVDNTGTLNAEGGTIALTAAAAAETVNSLVHVGGTLNADAVGTKGGEIYIYAQGANAVQNNVIANKGQKSGSSAVTVDGMLTASSKAGKGGKIKVLGDNVTLKTTAKIKANGKTGGGAVSVGGEAHGSGATPTAQTAIIEAGASVQADATDNGSGGTVIVWSDLRTRMDGWISAHGGISGGDGGFVETSSHGVLSLAGSVDASAPVGANGTWLLDPSNVTIGAAGTSVAAGGGTTNPSTESYTILASSISTALSNGNNVTITTTNAGGTEIGDITVNSSITKSAGGDATLTLKADGSIIFNSANVTSTTGKLNTVLWSNAGNTGSGAIKLTSSTITSNGGNVTLAGGLDDGANGGTAGDGVPDNYAFGTATNAYGIYIASNSTITSGVGNIVLHGTAYSNSSANSLNGVYINSGAVLQSTTGNVTLVGVGGNGTGTSTYDVGVDINASGTKITTVSGTISITGTGGSTTSGHDYGVSIDGGAQVTSTGTGAGLGSIVITGVGGGGASTSNNGIEITTAAVISSVDAAINLTGTGGSGGANISFGTYQGANILSTGAGSITITGNNSVSTGGFYMAGSSGYTDVIGGASATGNITLVADNIVISTGTLNVRTTGSITIKPRTASTSIGLNGGAGTLALTSTLLGSFTPGTSLTIGDSAGTGTGLVTINGWALAGKTYNVNVYGGAITFASSAVTWNNANNLFFQANAGNITAAQAFTKSGGATSTLTLKASGSIIETANITSTSGALNVIEWANSTNSGAGAISLTSSTITSLGGNVTLAGGLDNGANGGTAGDGVPDNYAFGTASYVSGVSLNGGGVNTGTGNIVLRGTAYSGAALSNLYGVYISGGAVLQSTNGNITLAGVGGAGVNYGYGVLTSGVSTKISTVSGAISLTGTGGSGSGGSNIGVRVDASSQIVSTGTGAGLGSVVLTGTGGSGTTNEGVRFGYYGTVSSVDAAINIMGSGGIGIGTYQGSNILSTGTGAITLTGVGVSADINLGSSPSYVDTIGGGSATGNIVLNANTLSGFGAAGQAVVLTAGSITIKPRTASTTIGLNGGAGTLALTSTLLGSFTPGTSLTIGDSAGTGTGLVTINGWALAGKTYNVNVYGGAITFASSAVTWNNANNLFFKANSGAITVSNALTATGTGALTLSAYSDIYTSSAITLAGGSLLLRSNNADSGAGAISLNAAIATNGGNITIGGGSGTISAGNGYAVGDATYHNGISVIGGLNAGGGNIIANGASYSVGGSNIVGVSVTSTVQTTGNGTIDINGLSNVVSNSGYNNIAFWVVNGGVVSTQNGAINITGSATAVSTGINWGVYVLPSGSSTIKTTGTGNITLLGTGSNSTAGNHGISSTVANGIQTTGSGNIILRGVSSGANSNGVYVAAANAINTAGTGNITIYTDVYNLNAVNNIATAGVLTLAPYTNITMGVGTSAGGTLNLSDNKLNYFTAGSYVFGATTVGNGAASTSMLGIDTAHNFGASNVTFVSGGVIAVSNTLSTTGGDITFSGPVVLNAAAAINVGSGTETFDGTVNGAYSLTASAKTFDFNGAWGGTTALGAVTLVSENSLSLPSVTAASLVAQTTGANADITLASGRVLTASGTGTAIALESERYFINNAGSSALSAANGRWLVYAVAPTGNTFGGLDSTNVAIWNTANGASVAQTGNRYVFAYQPTVTFASVSNSKTYGVDATTSVASSYTISGLQAGGANAYLADSNATAFSGTASVTSAGSAASASVAGGPYGITVAQGTLAGVDGYALNYISTGVLTINKAALTITANDQSVSYGSNMPALTASYSGFVNGDTANSLSTAPIVVSAIATTSGVGTHAHTITASGAVSSNYTISYVAGNLTITPTLLRIAAANQTITYGTAVPGSTLSYSGFINGDTPSSLITLPVISSAQSGMASPGTYLGNYTVSGASGNYTIVYISGNLTVQPFILPGTVEKTSQTSFADSSGSAASGDARILPQRGVSVGNKDSGAVSIEIAPALQNKLGIPSVLWLE